MVAVTLASTSAKVDLTRNESAFLNREDGDWRISALACTPIEGKADEEPYDCEVEA